MDITYNVCRFHGYDRAVKVCSYGRAGERNIEFNTCEFTAQVANKAVLEIDNQHNSSYVISLTNCTKNDVFPAWYNAKYTTDKSIVVNINGKRVASNAAELTAVLNSTANEVVLLDGEYDGLFLIKGKNFTVSALNKHKAVVKGRFGVEGNANTLATFKDLKLAVSANTFVKFPVSTNANSAGNYIIPIYCGNVTVEDCVFDDTTDDAGAIFYYAYHSGATTETLEKLTVKNSVINGERGIRSRSNVEVTNCKFYGLINPCLQIVGLGTDGVDSKVVFTGNESDNAVNGVTLKTSNHTIKNVTFEVSGNTNCNTIAYDEKKPANLFPETYSYTGEVTTMVVEP